MNLYLRAIAQQMNGAPTYAWIIDTDHVSDAFADASSAVGVCGPSDAPDDLLDALKAGTARSWTFRLYDDDGELNATGRLATLAESPADDESGPSGALIAPLDDYGVGGFGCTEVRWAGHPDWNMP